MSFDVVFSTVLFALVGAAVLAFAAHAVLVARRHMQKLQRLQIKAMAAQRRSQLLQSRSSSRLLDQDAAVGGSSPVFGSATSASAATASSTPAEAATARGSKSIEMQLLGETPGSF